MVLNGRVVQFCQLVLDQLFGDDDAPILPGAPSTIVDDYVKVFPDQKDEVEFVQ